MENPWKNVTWEHPYSESDKDIILNPKYHNKLQIFDTLPEPYTGNINSNVICLNGNPGRMDPRFAHKELFAEEMKKTLSHTSKEFIWLSEKLRSTDHWGIGWWENMTKDLRNELGYKPQLFVLEYFPYHSTKMFSFPSLPSDSYRNYLLANAMEEKKLIVIMRAQKRWEEIKEEGLGERLKTYSNKIVLHNPQRVYLTKNNMGEENWKKFIEALTIPIK